MSYETRVHVIQPYRDHSLEHNKTIYCGEIGMVELCSAPGIAFNYKENFRKTDWSKMAPGFPRPTGEDQFPKEQRRAFAYLNLENPMETALPVTLLFDGNIQVDKDRHGNSLVAVPLDKFLADVDDVINSHLHHSLKLYRRYMVMRGFLDAVKAAFPQEIESSNYPWVVLFHH